MRTGANNKKRLVNPKGYTMDIVNAVCDCYDRNRQTVPHELFALCRDMGATSPSDICAFIFEWVDDNIDYKVDPNGEQWIKTPARLISDGVGDCKSFSILICSFLTHYGIDNMFRFVAYKGSDYTHVYPVAVIDGEEIPLDVVAYKQRGIEIGNELKYKKKYDRMNSTRISELSGVGNMEISISNDMSVAELVAESCALVAMVQLDKVKYNKYQLLKDLIHTYQDNLDSFRLACYGWIYQGEGGGGYDYPSKGTMYYDIFLGNCLSFVKAQNNPRSGYAIEEEVLDIPAVHEAFVFLENKIYPYLNKYKQNTDNQKLAKDLLNVGMNGLYLFIPDNYLNSTQRQKKQNQNTFLEMMCGTSAFTEESAKNFVYAGFLSMYKCSPQSCFNAMFGKKVNTDYRAYLAGEDDDFCGQIEFNPNYPNTIEVQKAEVVNDSNIKGNVSGWIDSAVGWFTKVWDTVTGNSGTGNNTYRKLTPSLDDGGSGMGWVVLAGACVLGFMLLRKKRRK